MFIADEMYLFPKTLIKNKLGKKKYKSLIKEKTNEDINLDFFHEKLLLKYVLQGYSRFITFS